MRHCLASVCLSPLYSKHPCGHYYLVQYFPGYFKKARITLEVLGLSLPSNLNDTFPLLLKHLACGIILCSQLLCPFHIILRVSFLRPYFYCFYACYAFHSVLKRTEFNWILNLINNSSWYVSSSKGYSTVWNIESLTYELVARGLSLINYRHQGPYACFVSVTVHFS